ncbi:MAG: DHA2 family efflux MFS transporter permease subunit [Eggerthellaceae bacterium]|nr:DHA2 family efflux MFS transporter permease subunit [Eggerthellaceae bacterium]
MGLTRQQKMMIVVLMIGALLVVLNQTLLSPALPAIMADLNVNATTVQWLTSGYALVEAVVIPLNAYLLGRFSTRKLFVGGIALFALASAVAALAPNFPLLLLGRMLQASATGVVMPMVFTLVLLIFPREHRGAGMGIVSLIISFAPAVGPSLSGVLVDSVGWRFLFVIVAVLSAGLVLFAYKALENFEGFEEVPFDLPSVALMAFGMVSLLYGISVSTSSANIAIPVVLIVIGVVVLAAFTYRQLHMETPVLRVQTLVTRNFRTTVLIVAFLEAALVGSGVVLPIYIQNVLGHSATVTGLSMLPGAVLGAGCSLLAGRLFDRYGVRGLVLGGSSTMALMSVAVVFFGVDTNIIWVAVVYTVLSIGIQFLITPMDTWGMNSLDNSVLQHGNAVYSTFMQVGVAFGTAFIVSLTGLAPHFAPAGASAVEVTNTGTHLAFVGMCVILLGVTATIFIFVRDRKTAGAAGASEGKAGTSVDLAGVPGVDRPWYVADVMNPQAPVLGSDASVRDAIALLRETETSGLPIVDAAGKLCGFISDGDILKYLSKTDGAYIDSFNYFRFVESEDFLERLGDLLDLDVMRIATTRVESIEISAEAEDAFKLLSEKRIKKLPVTSDGRVVGSLSRRNIIAALDVIERYVR